MNALRVLHVIPSLSLWHGGPSRAMLGIERALADRLVAVTTVTTDDDGPGRRSPPDPAQPPPAGVSRVYFAKRSEFYKLAPGMPFWLWRNVGNHDVVHIHALFSFSSIAAAWVARLRGVPYILRPLGTLTQYGLTQRRPLLKGLSLRWLEGPALRHAAAVHFTSEEERVEAQACGIPMHGEVIPLGIESPPACDPTLFRATFPDLRSDRYVLYLSRLDPKKNLEGLLAAFARCAGKWPGVRLVVAGDGAPTYVNSLKRLATDLEIDSRVVWVGHIDGSLKSSALAGAALFVLPSFSENFGIAAAEALMAGLPCILGEGVAIASQVVQAGAGWAVAPDPSSIEAALVVAMDGRDDRATMSEKARALALEKFSAQAMGANLLRLYLRIKQRGSQS
jgi:glycosyltransferase involved in cell wall biosynthesis